MISTEDINFVFNNHNEILTIINNGEHIVGKIGYPNEKICPLMGSKIKLLKLLGKGKEGEAYLTKISTNSGEKYYVIKKGLINLTTESVRLDNVDNYLNQ